MVKSKGVIKRNKIIVVYNGYSNYNTNNFNLLNSYHYLINYINKTKQIIMDKYIKIGLMKKNLNENKKLAEKLKDKWMKKNDPILQRDSSYEPKPLPVMTIEKSIYQEKLKKRIDKEQFRPNPTRSNHLFTETTQQERRPQKKVRLEIYSKSQEPEHRSVVRINHEPKRSLVDKILKSTDDCPLYVEKRVSKLPTNKGQPSKEYTKMNNRMVLLPHLMEDPVPTLKRQNTFDRLFVNGEEPKSSRFHFVNVPAAKETMSGIISYENGPKYRDVYYAGKPNSVQYKTIINSIENEYRK